MDYFDEERAVAELLMADVLYVSETEYVDYPILGRLAGGPKQKIISLYLLCNDTFGPMSDGEPVTLADLPILYAAFKNNPEWGPTYWVAKKRNLQPWHRMKEFMREKGVWTEEMEKLKSQKI